MEHVITVAALRALLSGLDDDMELAPNAVQNLAIFKGDLQIGYISLRGEGSYVDLYEEAA